MKNDEWLQDMVNAALEDPAEEVSEPDFSFLKKTDSHETRSVNLRPRAPWLLPAAAALLAAGLAAPLGIHAGRQSEERRINREIQELFVEGLIGKNLFDEGLASNDSETWFSDIEINGEFFGS